MLRLAFRCSLNLVKRTKPRLVRCEITERPAVKLDSNRAQTRFLGTPNLRVEQPRLLMRESKSADSKSETPIVGSGGLVPDHSWIPRPLFEQEVLKNFNENWNAFKEKSGRPNDFFGIVIPGGIGVGKTRAGLEIPAIVAQSVKHSDVKLVWRISLDIRDLKDGLEDKSRTTGESAIKILYGIFATAMSHHGVITDQQIADAKPLTLDELVEEFIAKQSESNNLKPSDNAVLYLHVDEFQDDPALMARLSRDIGKYTKSPVRPNVLVILVLSGIGSQEFIAKLKVSSYRMDIVNLKLSVEPEWINSLVDQFINRIQDLEQQQQVIQFREEYPVIFFKLLQTTGGIPMLVMKLLRTHLKYPRMGKSPARAAQEAYERCIKDLYRSYAVGPHLTWFTSKKHAILFLKKAFFKEPVGRGDLLNGLTVGDLEESGLIYLEPTEKPGEFTIGLPLMMLYYHNYFGGLDLLTGLNWIEYPFKTLNETSYEEFVAQIYAFSWRLLSYETTKEVTLKYLHRGCLTASPQLEQKKITLQHAVSVGVEQMTELTKDSYGEFQLKTDKNTFTSETPAPFVLNTRKRFPGADILIPGKLQIQLKWSQYVGDLQAIREPKSPNDSTYYITEDLVTKELNKIHPDMPLILVSPKAPQEALQKACLAGAYPQLGLITDKKCMKFLEPFYCYSIDPTANSPVQLQAPDRRNEHTEAAAATPTATTTETSTEVSTEAKH